MNTSFIPLTPRLLELVLAVQHKRSLVIAENRFRGIERAWGTSVREYIMSLPIEEVGLSKNEATLRTLAEGGMIAGGDAAALDAAQNTPLGCLPDKFAFNPQFGVVAITE